MNYIILIIAGIAGVVLGIYLGRRRRAEKEKAQGKPFDETRGREREDAKKKRENLEKMRQIFAERGKLTNDNIEAILGVSDATATRYLDELEKEGLIRQVGRTGKHVYYERV